MSRRSQSSVPWDGGDLASPLNNPYNDYLRPADDALPWHIQASPIIEDTAEGNYELTAISG